MKLSEVIANVEVLDISGTDTVEIASVESDSRRIRKGSLFVAVPGFEVDGARFIDQAIERGAVAVITERSVPPSDGVAMVRVEDARKALAMAASYFFGRPASKLALIGVTGTSGKTTTTKMVESILDQTGEPVGLIGTIEYRAGDQREVADRTTPDATVLQEWFARMVDAGVRRAVMEVSSHALALKRTADVPFSAAVFTNLSRDHFDFHSDFEDYFAAKKILFSQIDRSKKTAIVNGDDEWGRKLIAELGEAVITFGLEDADIRPQSGFRADIDGLRGTVVTPWGEVEMESPLLGLPNLYNWLGAIGAALTTGVSLAQVETGIRALRSIPGRFERVGEYDAPAVIVDYAHKPDALEKLLLGIRAMTPERRIVLVFGCGGNRDKGKRPLMGEVAAKLADRTILTSDNPRKEDPEAIIDEIEQGFRRVREDGYERMADRRAAIEAAISGADQQQIVIIAGKGHEDYQVSGDRIERFDDREEAFAALEKKFQESCGNVDENELR